ncbi:MAG: hypothetical protein KH586_01280 [Tannerella sp.]|uniref:hypothetical protein n=1 Tax=uncultured Coprobacter sp. TaxID=1720550 RepID=UPI00260B99E7|nr:hypothetical protein [uncultured Coprobacter sp.]MBS6267574.1 hypothetical protein [Tannerella sp.]
MKHYYPTLSIVIGLFLLSLIGCREKGTPFSFTTPEGEEVSLVIPPGFEDQRTASPWKKLDTKIENHFSAYVCNADNPDEIIELYFNLREFPSDDAKEWQRKPENRDLYDYIEYPDSNFICVLQAVYIPKQNIYDLFFDADLHYAELYLQKHILNIQLYYPYDSLMTERAKSVMNDIVKSIKIKKK